MNTMNTMDLRLAAERLLMAMAEFLLRLFCVPAELLLHRRVGERFVGVSGLFALLLLLAWGMWCGSVPLYGLIAACVIRMAVMRVTAVRSRHDGLPIHSRSEGEPWLCQFVPLEPHFLRWLEPVLLLAAAMILAGISESLGHYLEISALALAALTAVRACSSYYRTLDAIDEQIERKIPTVQVIEMRAIPEERVQAIPRLAESTPPLLASGLIPSPFLPAATFDDDGGGLFSGRLG